MVLFFAAALESGIGSSVSWLGRTCARGNQDARQVSIGI